jgi:hypothetical protein
LERVGIGVGGGESDAARLGDLDTLVMADN